MDVLLGIGNPTQRIAELTVEPVGSQVGYMFNYKSNIDWLKNEFDGLRVDRNGMQQKVDQARRNVEEILDHVECWMREANRLNEEADDFLMDEEGHAKAKCSFRFFPNLVLRHRLSKKAYKMATSIAKLRVDGPKDPISCSRVVPSSDEVIEGYEAFESRNSTMNQIMDALRNPEVHVVGLHGMGGIGKTMLAKEVSRLARLDKLFEIDVMVSVSQDPKPKDIQQHIAEKLGLKLDEETMSVRADKLRHRLRQEKKILITLDDVWDKLDLQEIGVSFGNDQKGCKILLTSKSAGVCDIMKAEKSTTFNLQVLTPSEATKLFNQNVGKLATSPNFKNLANEIIEECAGLPIAILIVASTLKNEEQEVWKDVLRELRTSSPTNIEGMDTKVYSSVRLSYNHLPNEETKNLLLLCSLHEEDENILIEDLMKYGMGLSWFHNITTLKDARNSVYHLVVKLKERSLLLDGEEEGWVKLHDVIRDACLSFASKDKCMHFIRDIAHFKEFIENEKLVKEATGISLPHEAINHLPQKLKWPHLKLLWLREEEFELKILDEQCLEEMKDLRVLYLSNIQVKQTCFFSSLQKLQTLCLRSCDLGDVASIGELNKLKILDLSKSDFLKLPKKFGQLTQLQLLDINFCSTLLYVEPGMLSNLKNLEQLHMKSNFGEWGVEGVNSEGNASLVELNDLDKLTTLCVTVSNINNVPKYWLSNKMDLEKYEISIGDWGVFGSFHTKGCKTSKMLKLKLLKSHQVKGHGLERLIRTAEMLYLDGFVDLNDVFELDNRGFQHVEHFLFICNEGARYFINPPHPCHAFLSLKSLVLVQMRNLEKICHGKLISGTFGKLKKVEVAECKRLKSLFSFSIAKHFEQIQVSFCPELQEIGTHENEHESQNVINNSMNETKSCELETLKLFGLPKLTQFFWPKQEINSISDRRDELFNSKVVFPKLRETELSRIEVVKLWPDELHEASFMKNLTTLKVTKCSGLKYLSSFDVAKSFEVLESLELSDLETLKVVIVVKKQMDEVERMEKKLFPKLHTLKLNNLQNMAEFCSQCCFEFSSLKVLRIKKCPKVEDLDLIGKLSNLEVLDLSYSSFVELPRGIERLTQLNSLDLSGCESLKVIQPDVISKLIHLKELKMLKSHVTWGAEGVNTGTKRSSASLSELKNLPQLIVLKLFVPDFRVLPKDFFSEKWKECEITTNKGSYMSFSTFRYLYSSKLELIRLKKREINVWESGLQVLLKCSEELVLDGLEDDMDDNDMDDMVHELDKEGFPQLRMLTLKNNGGVRYLVNSVRHSSNAAFVSLERLYLYNLATLERICHGELIRGSFGKLTNVEVTNCARLKSLFPVATQLEELEKLDVVDCKAMAAIFTFEREDDNDLGFTKLEFLSLKNLPGLVQFCTKLKTTSTSRWKEELSEEELGISMPFFEAKVHMPKLRELLLERIDCQQIWYHQPSSRFNNLVKLDVRDCHNLKSLIPYSMVTNLVSLSVLHCENMEEIISTKKEEENLISFNKLETLQLSNLRSLRRFNAVGTVNFSSLSKMTLVNCFKLTTFVPSSTKAPQRETFFDGEVHMPNLRELELKKIGCKQIWHHQPSPIFNNLETLKVYRCHNLKSLMPYSLVTNLKCLWVCNCENMEEVISIEKEEENLISFNKLETLQLFHLRSLQRFNTASAVNFPSLSEMIMENCFKLTIFVAGSTKAPQRETFFGGEVHMSNLSQLQLKEVGCKQIWHHQPSPIFNNLVSLDVHGCHDLKSLMSNSIATNLESLSTLVISNCENMEEVISTEKGEENLISFNKLNTLSLYKLRSLRRFNAAGAVNFPSLSNMILVNCFKLTTFVPGSTKAPQRETFFGGEVIIPKLNSLRVDNCEIINEIFNLEGQSCFGKLENLDLDNKLVIPKPMHTCGKDKGKDFQYLKLIRINRCNGLKSLTTPSVYFQYLIELEVSECNGLMNLFSSSTVKGMVSLQKITISECKGMTEIIGNDHEGVVESEIILEQLSDLKLCDLPNLRCFYSGNSTITFPCLDNLVVSQCFEMKTFSHGIVNSPFLDRIITEPKSEVKEEQDWEGNINSTIQKIYKKWRKKSESSSNEQVTSEKDTTMGNNEPSTELTELSNGDQVKRDSWKGKEQATKYSSSGSNSAFF